MLTILVILLIVIYILSKGAGAINSAFILRFPSEGMRAGGILPAIVGTMTKSDAMSDEMAKASRLDGQSKIVTS